MPRAFVLRSLSWAAGHLSDRTFAVSEVAASCARELDRTLTHKISLVSDGVPEPRPVPKDEVFALSARLGIPFGEAVVGTVSRLRHEKGVDLLVRAAILLRATHPCPPGDSGSRARRSETASTGRAAWGGCALCRSPRRRFCVVFAVGHRVCCPDTSRTDRSGEIPDTHESGPHPSPKVDKPRRRAWPFGWSVWLR